MTDYLPEPLPQVLRALRAAVPETGAHAGEPARIGDVRKQMKEQGKGVPVAGALHDLVALGHAVVQSHPIKHDKSWRPKTWR